MRQSEAAADANDMRVERHDQPRPIDTRPDPEIQRVVTHHPAEKEIQAFARAAA